MSPNKCKNRIKSMRSPMGSQIVPNFELSGPVRI
jgi:hypothetical protein